MADNGWKLQHTFSHHLFEPETNVLNYAGRVKMQHILTQVPPHRRQVYVLEGQNPQETTNRVASVYETIAQIAPGMPPCAVLTTKIEPPGGSGAYWDYLDQSYRLSLPPPRLPSTGVGGGSTSSGQDAGTP
jgi:hypothetical protein